jgi:hypothetical protein
MDDHDEDEEAAFPMAVTLAAWVWTLNGMAWAAVGLLFGFSAARGGNSPDVIAIALCSGLVPGGLLARAGYKTVHGTATDCLLPALLSVLVCLIVTGVAIALILTLPVPFAVSAAILLPSAVLLLASGLFALYGRGAYLRWRREHARRDEVARGKDEPPS